MYLNGTTLNFPTKVFEYEYPDNCSQMNMDTGTICLLGHDKAII